MTSNDEIDFDSEDGLRELLGEGPVPFPLKTPRVFEPWHRPRKQYVRGHQWTREIGFLARDTKLEGELRYLTLPGSDFLDIRHLAKTVCNDYQVRLKYLGFNTAASPLDDAQAELNTNQFSVKRLLEVHPESDVIPGDFRKVGDPRSVQWQRVSRAGHFHAINLDLCGGFAGNEKADGIPNYFAALQAILQSQARFEQEFLLFITTRIDDDNVEPNTHEKLTEIAQKIHDTCNEYASEFADAWAPEHAGISLSFPDSAHPTEVFMLGLSQWIVSRAVEAGLKATVKSFMTYRTGAGTGDDDIASIAIRFKPAPVINTDQHGLVKVFPEPPALAALECAQSARIPKLVRNRVLVDGLLGDEAALFEQCLSESADLLSAAGYDTDSYMEWARSD